MSTRRVILGNLGGGTFGLRVALPGHDVVAEAGNPDALSFDSGWTDIVKMIQVGVASKTYDHNFTDVLFPDQGYQPFAEVRWRSGSRIYDDSSPISVGVFPGIGAVIKSDRLKLPGTLSGSPVAYDVVYAVFQVPVPAPAPS